MANGCCAGDVTLKGAVLYDVGIEMDGFQFDTGFINYMVQCYGRYVTTSKNFYHWLWGIISDWI